MRTAVDSVFRIDAATPLAVYGRVGDITPGLRVLRGYLAKETQDNGLSRLAYNPGTAGRQELFSLTSLTLTFLSLKTASGVDLTASVSRLGIYTDGFEVDDISLPAVSAPALGQVRIGSFLELTNPTLNIAGLKYDGTLAGTITITTDAAVLFPNLSVLVSLGRRVRRTAGGIGLPLARQFVEGHGGTLALLSQVGEGTVVTIELPRG